MTAIIESSLSQSIAKFVEATDFARLPEDAVLRGKRTVLDFLACAVFGHQAPSLKPLLRYVQRRSHRPEASILCGGGRATAFDAALVNGAFVHTTEMSETYTRALAHPGNSVMPATLALGEREKRSGRDVLAATTVGYELLIRFGLAAGPDFVLKQGLHPPATFGAFGAAAAAARVLGYDEKLTANTLGIAACCVPTALIQATHQQATIKDLYQANASAIAVMSADLAAEGLGGATEWLEPWARAVPQRFDLSPFQTLGKQWLVSSGGLHFKLLPVMAMAAPTLGAIKNLIQENQIDHRQIREILVESSDRIFLGEVGFPQNIVATHASLQFLAAAALVRQQEFLDDRYLVHFLRQELLEDQSIRQLFHRVVMKGNPEFDHNMEVAWPMKFEARVTLRMQDGTELVGYHDTWPETSTMNFDQVADKFRALAADSVAASQVEEVVSAVRDLERLDDVSKLVGLLA